MASQGQQIVGAAGPWGAAISGVSQGATGALDKQGTDASGAIASGIFNPSRNITDTQGFTGAEKAASLALPGVQGVIANRKAKQNQNIPLIDPLEAQRLNEINQIRKSISTGTNIQTQNAVNQARAAGAQTQGQLVKSTGGDVGGTIGALLKAQRGTQAATNQAVAQGQSQNPFFQNLQQQLLTRTSQRKLELGLLNRAQSNAEAAQAAKEANLNRNAFIATNAPVGESQGQGLDILKTFTDRFGAGSGQPETAVPDLATPGIAGPVNQPTADQSQILQGVSTFPFK